MVCVIMRVSLTNSRDLMGFRFDFAGLNGEREREIFFSGMREGTRARVVMAAVLAVI